MSGENRYPTAEEIAEANLRKRKEYDREKVKERQKFFLGCTLMSIAFILIIIWIISEFLNNLGGK